MEQKQSFEQGDVASVREMLAGSGYSLKAIDYYLNKASMGVIDDADQASELVGSCGDTMKVYFKMSDGIITDVKYQVLGCPGAVSAAMAAADLAKGKRLEEARKLNDGDVFRVLEELPATKHHCIQLAVKTLHKAIDDYRNANR